MIQRACFRVDKRNMRPLTCAAQVTVVGPGMGASRSEKLASGVLALRVNPREAGQQINRHEAGQQRTFFMKETPALLTRMSSLGYFLFT